MTHQVGCWRVMAGARLPLRATDASACYDIHACLQEGARITVYDSYNDQIARIVQDASIKIWPGDRVLVPTGLIFDIPDGFSLRIHPRSGLSVKKGITLINAEAVIDSDYVEQTLVALINNSDRDFVLRDGDRIAQVELSATINLEWAELDAAPEAKTQRRGGFGSTGVES